MEADYLSWEDNCKIVIKSNGMVIFVPPVTYHSSCVADSGRNPLWGKQVLGQAKKWLW